MRRLLPILIILSLGGCTAVDAPSLAPRAAEKIPIDAPAPYVEETGTADPALAARLAPLIAQAESGHRDFTAAQQDVAKAAAAAGQSGSESWILAQQALSALDGKRLAVQDAAAKLDAIRFEPANAAPGNRQAIDQAGARLQALVDEEVAAMAQLAAKLN